MTREKNKYKRAWYERALLAYAKEDFDLDNFLENSKIHKPLLPLARKEFDTAKELMEKTDDSMWNTLVGVYAERLLTMNDKHKVLVQFANGVASKRLRIINDTYKGILVRITQENRISTATFPTLGVRLLYNDRLITIEYINP